MQAFFLLSGRVIQLSLSSIWVMQAFFLLLESVTAFSLFDASFLSPPGECYSFLSLQSEWCKLSFPSHEECYSFLSLQSEWCKLSFSSWRVLQLALFSIWVMQLSFSSLGECYSFLSLQYKWCKLSFSSWKVQQLSLFQSVIHAFFPLLECATVFSLFNLSDVCFFSHLWESVTAFSLFNLSDASFLLCGVVA